MLRKRRKKRTDWYAASFCILICGILKLLTSCPAVSQTLNLIGPRLVWKFKGCTSTPRVATYFFSNSPVKWRFTNVVFPTPPSPTRINLNSGVACRGKKSIHQINININYEIKSNKNKETNERKKWYDSKEVNGRYDNDRTNWRGCFARSFFGTVFVLMPIVLFLQ